MPPDELDSTAPSILREAANPVPPLKAVFSGVLGVLKESGCPLSRVNTTCAFAVKWSPYICKILPGVTLLLPLKIRAGGAGRVARTKPIPLPMRTMSAVTIRSSHLDGVLTNRFATERRIRGL